MRRLLPFQRSCAVRLLTRQQPSRRLQRGLPCEARQTAAEVKHPSACACSAVKAAEHADALACFTPAAVCRATVHVKKELQQSLQVPAQLHLVASQLSDVCHLAATP